ncbi:hypothetical protein COCNU_scaffold001660G000010 [Cocos nucifera]|nr:hypothetical protein [Cocos nucifera]
MFNLDLRQLIWSSLGTILKSRHQMLAYIKRMHRQEVEAQKSQEDLRAEVYHVQERVDEVVHLVEEKMVDIKRGSDKALDKEPEEGSSSSDEEVEENGGRPLSLMIE